MDASVSDEQYLGGFLADGDINFYFLDCFGEFGFCTSLDTFGTTAVYIGMEELDNFVNFETA